MKIDYDVVSSLASQYFWTVQFKYTGVGHDSKSAVSKFSSCRNRAQMNLQTSHDQGPGHGNVMDLIMARRKWTTAALHRKTGIFQVLCNAPGADSLVNEVELEVLHWSALVIDYI